MKRVATLALSLLIALAPSAAHAQDAWPEPDHHVRRALRARRLHGPGRPADRALRREGIGQAGHRRKPSGRRRHRGDAGRRDCGAGRLHLLRLQRRRRLGRALRPEGRLRSDAGPGAGRHRQLDRAGGHRQEGPAGEDDGRARVLRQGQSRQAQLRLQRRRRPDALTPSSCSRPAPAPAGAHPVQGRRAVDRRCGLRRSRLRFRQHDRRPAADRGRNGPRPGRDLARTQPLLSRSALGARGGRPQLHRGDVERDHRPRRRRRSRSSASCRRS